MNSTDCIIYCTSNISIKELRAKIADFMGSDTILVSFIEKCFYELSIRNNDDFDAIRQVDFPDGFLYFKFIIDIGFITNYEIEKCVEEVAKILEWLWRLGIPSVATCDYEDLLPKNGGYNSQETPWAT